MTMSRCRMMNLLPNKIKKTNSKNKIPNNSNQFHLNDNDPKNLKKKQNYKLAKNAEIFD